MGLKREGTGCGVGYQIPEGVTETKKQACERLDREGRLQEFRALQRTFFRAKNGFQRLMSRTDAFYEALKSYPPLPPQRLSDLGK